MTKAAVAAAKAAAAKPGTAAAGAASAGAVRALNLATMDDGTPMRLPLTANQPVTRDVSTLVIPSECPWEGPAKGHEVFGSCCGCTAA